MKEISSLKNILVKAIIIALIPCSAMAQGTLQNDIAYKDINGINVSENNQLEKITSTGWQNAFANSNCSMAAYANALIEYVPGNTASTYALGIKEISKPSIGDVAELEHGFRFNDNQTVEVIEQGVVINGPTSFTSTDIFQIERKGKSIRYIKNGGEIIKTPTNNKVAMMLAVTIFTQFGVVERIKASFSCPLAAKAGADASICLGGSKTIGGNPTAQGGKSPYTYSWAPSIGLNNTTVAHPNASPFSTTNYQLFVTDNSGTMATDEVLVTVNPLAVSAGNDIDIYLSNSTTLTASGAQNYSWSPSTGLSSTNNATVTAQPTTTTTYMVVGSKPNGCYGIDHITVTVQTTIQTVGYFRSKQSGNWEDVSTWEASDDNLTWNQAVVKPSHLANSIIIRSGHNVVITGNETFDQTTIDLGGKLTYSDLAGIPLQLYNGIGTDLIVNGTFEDFGSPAIAWSPSSTWSLGSNATIIRSRNTPADSWYNNYEGGVSSIPSTANWIVRKTGKESPHILGFCNVYYPNLIIENTTNAIWITAQSASFYGNDCPPVIKGNLNIGGNAFGNIQFKNENTNVAPVLVSGNLTVNSGSTLRNFGTGFEVRGDVTLNGVLSNGNFLSKFLFTGSKNQIISGNNIIFKNLELNKVSTVATVTLNSPLFIKEMFTLTKGYLFSSTANLLTLDTGSTVSGASDSSFVNGAVKKIGNTAFTFPIGKGYNYQGLSISAPSLLTDAFTAEYYNSKQTLGNAHDATFNYISACEYFTLLRNVGNSNVDVTLSYDQLSCIPSLMPAPRIIGWNGSQWNDLGISNFTISLVGGNITTGVQPTAYNAFTFGNNNTAIDSIIPHNPALDSAIRNSEYIFTGTVIDQKTFWNADHTDILTSNTVSVSICSQGNLQNNQIIEIITEGGEIDDNIVHSSHTLGIGLGAEGMFFCKNNARYSIPAANQTGNLTFQSTDNSEFGFIRFYKDPVNPFAFGFNQKFESSSDLVNYFGNLSGIGTFVFRIKGVNHRSIHPIKKQINFKPQFQSNPPLGNAENRNDLPNSVFQTPIVGLSIKNVKMDGPSPATIEFDVCAQSGWSSIYLHSLTFFITYNNVALGNNIVGDGAVSVSRGQLITSSADYQEPEVSFESNGTIRLDVKREEGTSHHKQIEATPKTLVHVNIVINNPDCNQNANIAIRSYAGVDSSLGRYFNTSDGSGDILYINGETFGDTIFNPLCTDPIISSFTPWACAGRGDIVNIYGFNLGNMDGIVEFSSADNGGATFEILDRRDFITWNDNHIAIRVPSFVDSSTSPHAIIGTGKFAIHNGTIGGALPTFGDPIHMAYNIGNTNVTDAFYGDKEKTKVNILNNDKSGGYNFKLSQNIASNSAAVQIIKLAIEKWRCATGVNFTLDTVNTISSYTKGDGICTISFDPMTALGVTSSWRKVCDGEPYISDIDIKLRDPNSTNWSYALEGADVPPGSIDFYHVILHELGHGHNIQHVNDEPSLMYYSTGSEGKLAADRGLDITGNVNNIMTAFDAGNYITSYSTGVSCAGENLPGMQYVADCAYHGNWNDNNAVIERKINSFFEVYPNPFQNEITFDFDLTATSEVKISTLNSIGQEISIITNRTFKEGNHKINFGDDLKSGIYIVKFVVNGKLFTKKIIKH